MRPKGVIGIEFVVSTALFLVAFWYIYVQSALMLTPQLQRADVREIGVQLYSSLLVSDPAYGFAENNSGVVAPNILNKTQLDGVDCGTLLSPMAGAEFAFRVTTAAKAWECNAGIPKQGVVRRPVFVHFGGAAYKPGFLEVWAA